MRPILEIRYTALYTGALKALTVVLLFFISLQTVAQKSSLNLSDKSLKEIKGAAKNALRLGDTYTALFYYEEWANRTNGDNKLIFTTADLYRQSRNYAKAEEWFKRVTEEDDKRYALSRLYLGQVQMSLEKYNKAKKNLEEFKKLSRNLKDSYYRKMGKAALLSCDFALANKDSSVMAVTQNLGNSVNMPHIEFSPIVTGNETLIYGSLKAKGVKFYDRDRPDSIKLPLRKLYTAKKENGKWVSKGELKGPFNKTDAHAGNAVISEDGKRMYYTLCKKNWQNKVICELYFTEKTSNGKWDEPTKMNGEINLPNYTTTQPAIGRESKKNREIIYFVSDRPGGKGGLDIWYTEYRKKRGYFKTPKNAGSKINSVGTECTPFYDLSAHRLYFSSDGLIGFGGLDVYSADGEKSKWEEPRNLNRNINSSADDLDFTLAEDRKGGFIVSNRKGGTSLLSPTCCDDIYEFNYTKFIDLKLKGRISDSLGCLKNYKLNLYIKDKESGEKYLSKQYIIDTCGFYIQLQEGLDYSVEVEKLGYFNSVTEINTKNVGESKDFELTTKAVKIPSQPIPLKNIFYEYNSPELTAKAKSSIDSSLYLRMVQNPKIIIQVSAHTDSKGTEAYNQRLSEKRAQNVVRYLTSKGIDGKRLKGVGYGESKPIAPNENADGSDNPEGRKLNRRTEIEIIGEVEEEEDDSDE